MIKNPLDILPDSEEERRGALIAAALNLKPLKSRALKGNFRTSNGVKSPLGLFRLLRRLVEDGE